MFAPSLCPTFGPMYKSTIPPFYPAPAHKNTHYSSILIPTPLRSNGDVLGTKQAVLLRAPL